jgi:APA family basic amino acid/polyamine antiporter
MWAYNGWNEMTYVAGEVRDPGRTLPRALAGGLGIVALLYVGVNTSYFYVLAPAQVASVSLGSTVATDVMTRIFGPASASLLAAVFAVSVFSALQVTSMVGARVPYAMAQEGLFFASLARVSPRSRVPIRALLAQTAWAIVLIATGSFDTLTDYAMFAILVFVGMATASVFVFRRRLPEADRPYRTWGYPLVPGLALSVTAWLLLNTLATAPRQAFAGLALMALGVPFFWYWSRAGASRRDP